MYLKFDIGLLAGRLSILPDSMRTERGNLPGAAGKRRREEKKKNSPQRRKGRRDFKKRKMGREKNYLIFYRVLRNPLMGTDAARAQRTPRRIKKLQKIFTSYPFFGFLCVLCVLAASAPCRGLW